MAFSFAYGDEYAFVGKNNLLVPFTRLPVRSTYLPRGSTKRLLLQPAPVERSIVHVVSVSSAAVDPAGGLDQESFVEQSNDISPIAQDEQTMRYLIDMWHQTHIDSNNHALTTFLRDQQWSSDASTIDALIKMLV